jgi:hypothetical protein
MPKMAKIILPVLIAGTTLAGTAVAEGGAPRARAALATSPTAQVARQADDLTWG